MKEPPPPIEIEGEDEYELDKIIDSRLHYNKLQYRAKWKGYSPEHNEVWYPTENLNQAEHTVHRFHRRYPGKPGVDSCFDHYIVLRTPALSSNMNDTHAHQRATPSASPTTLPPLAQNIRAHQEER